MDHQLKRLFNLVRRTGDRLVVTDPNGEDTYVLMGLEAYEKLADYIPSSDEEPWEPPRFKDGFDEYNDYDDEYSDETDDFDPNWEIPDEFLTEEARAQKNNDSLIVEANGYSPNLSSNNEKSTQSSWQTPKDIWETMKPAGSSSETWDSTKFTPEEQRIVKDKFGPNQDQPNEIKSQAPLEVSNNPEKESQNSQKPQESQRSTHLIP